MTRPPNPPSVKVATPDTVEAMARSYPAMVGYLESVIAEVERIIDGTNLMAKGRRKWVKETIAAARNDVAAADAIRSERQREIEQAIDSEIERMAS